MRGSNTRGLRPAGGRWAKLLVARQSRTLPELERELFAIDLDARTMQGTRSLDCYRDEHGRFPFVAPKTRASGRALTRRSHRRLAPRAPPHNRQARRRRARLRRRARQTAHPAADATLPVLRTLKLAKLAAPRLRFHDLRHAYATHGLASGLTAHAVADLLGQADAGLVLRRYGHALPDELACAADRIAA